MKIDKVMNNNVVSSIDEDGQEIICLLYTSDAADDC